MPWRDGRPQGDVLAALGRLTTRVSAVYLHIDFDGFAPEVAPSARLGAEGMIRSGEDLAGPAPEPRG